MTEQQKEMASATEAAANEQYLQKMNNHTSIDNLVKAAEDYQRGIRREVWPTGFLSLDAELDGGFYGSQLVIAGAVSSLGKSTWCLQIATQMAQQRKDVLIFSLEMSRDELNAKIISRYSHVVTEEAIQDHAFIDGFKTRFTTREILKGDVHQDGADSEEYYSLAVDRAKAIAPHIYIYVGNNDVSVDTVEDVIKRHIAATGNKPAVILDYMQIMSPSKESVSKHFDLRRSTNDDVTKLKVIAREFDIPVIAISAFNRQNYTEPVNMGSFRESSAIEYSADILLGLQYKGMDYSDKEFYTKDGSHGKGRESDADHTTRVMKLFEDMQKIAADGGEQPIEVKILKNRNGSRGMLDFRFIPKYNHFEDGIGKCNIPESDFRANGAATAKNNKTRRTVVNKNF